jgi:hypothetical protein
MFRDFMSFEEIHTRQIRPIESAFSLRVDLEGNSFFEQCSGFGLFVKPTFIYCAKISVVCGKIAGRWVMLLLIGE